LKKRAPEETGQGENQNSLAAGFRYILCRLIAERGV
jgi:hypothetical protein